jgi:hypothetical protein
MKPVIVIIEGYGQTRDGDGAGLATLRDRLEARGHLVLYCTCDDDIAGLIVRMRKYFPRAGQDLAIVGYSYGGGKAQETVEALAVAGVPVVSLVHLDAVPRWRRGQFQNLAQVLSFGLVDGGRFALPSNVGRCLSVYQRNGWPRGVRVASDPRLTEVDASQWGLGHLTIPGDGRLHTRIVEFLGDPAE